MANTADELSKLIEDITKVVTEDFMGPDDMKILVTNFIIWNDPNMFFLTGQAKDSVKINTNYEDGEITGDTPYFAKVYYETATKGKLRPFETTATERASDIEKVSTNLLEQRINKIK